MHVGSTASRKGFASRCQQTMDLAIHDLAIQQGSAVSEIHECPNEPIYDLFIGVSLRIESLAKRVNRSC